MADIELVIKIPEIMYNFVNMKRPNGCFNEFDKFDTYDLSKCIRNGTPLPKGHGRLIDADVLVDGFEDNYEFCEEVNATPTIIEADKGE